MVNIAFYLSNKNIRDVDCSDVFNGNPGIGGSDYALLLLACSLTQNHNDLNVLVYVDEKSSLPPVLKTRKVSDLIRQTKEDNIHILTIILGSFDNHTLDSFHQNEHLKIVIWASNFFWRKDLSYYAKNKQISKIVCVGFEQLDLYRDLSVFKKMAAIYNGAGADCTRKQQDMIPFSGRPFHVTYIGNLVPQKGVHILAKAWPQILKVYPDAVLNVIGSGKLYNRNARLGDYGIAGEEYEKTFMPYLVDSDGQILPSVKFLGILGKEKSEILQKTRVGVPNPSGRTETFGYTAIEMQACGTLVATVKCPAYLETVCSSAGILYDKQKSPDKKLAESVISLLSRDDNHHEEVMQFLETNFSIDKVSGIWYRLFTDMMEGKENPVVPVKANNTYRLKHWKEANRKLKNFIPFGYKILPSLWYVDDFVWKMKGLFMRKHLIKYLYRRYILKKIIEQYL
ncbi:MAG: glycosyltransferase family 4 protein [Prevotella sp.]|jgi:glycosyltransferase involved in cell wall biosynthesis|nr:glycosyltransferase family 4 protein [Prevotella sp.]